METKNPQKNNLGRLSKHQRQFYFQFMNSLIDNLSSEDQAKMDYARDFIKKLPLPGLVEGDEITLGPMDIRILQYFLYCAILHYDTPSNNDEIK